MSFTSEVNINQLNELYPQIFPQVNDKNGVFGDKAQWYGLVDQNRLVAFCTIGVVNDQTIFLYNVGVHPTSRHQGFGCKLMENIIEHYKKYDIVLFVNKKNRIAIKLYQKYNFKLAERLFIPPLGEICMKRCYK